MVMLLMRVMIAAVVEPVGGNANWLKFKNSKSKTCKSFKVKVKRQVKVSIKVKKFQN